MKNRMKFTNKTLKIILTLLLIVGQFSISTRNISAEDPKLINNWAELVAAAASGGTYKLNTDISAEGSITVSSNFKLEGNNKTITQKQRDTYDSLFKVSNGATLELGTGLTLSGKVVKCNSGDASAEKKVEPNNYTLEQFKKTDPAGPPKVKLASDYGNLAERGGIYSGTKQVNIYDEYPNALEFEVVDINTTGGTRAVLQVGNEYLKNASSINNYRLNDKTYTDKVIVLQDTSGNFITAADITNGTKYRLYDTWYNKNLIWDSGEKCLTSKDGTPVEFTATVSGGGGSGEPYWMIPTAKPPFSDDKKQKYTVKSEAEAALKKLNEEIDPVDYWVVPGTTEPKYYDENDPVLVAAMAAYNNRCADPACPLGTEAAYTKDSFPSGTADAPRGFFVQVDAGTVTLAGATLENFKTSRDASKTPKFVAPVVASGANAKFIVQDGKIQNNIVGYIADDNKSGEGANSIKMYVKGAAPNARRNNAPDRRRNNAQLDITGTAGAVIYANGAQGTISGGSIGYNRGDTGGVMVSDEGSFLTITTGADINHNVGVQFGGGTTAEDGGSIYMNGGEIHDNVAWFGGGAAFVTENGIDWLLGDRNMSKSDRKDGSFTLANGKIYGNSAFTRGGGFLVDSDGVAFLGGEIYNNTSRVLGGAAYVMGDHADYSYTLYIEQGDIKNNEAIDASTKEASVTSTPISKKLKAPANSCDTPTGSLYGGDAEAASTDDIADFQRINDGTGGGVWTCSYGSTVLDLNPNYVSISNNTAAGATGDPSRYTNINARFEKANAKNKESGGQDFHSDNGGDGTLLMLPSGNTQWYDENAKANYNADGADGEIRNLTNQNKTRTNQGVQIYNNASRRGGGLAADGTFVFGPQRDIARIVASLDISKEWDASIPADERKPVIIRVGVESGDKKAIVEDIELDGKANATDEESIHENAPEDGKWSGGFNLPVSLEAEDGTMISVFKLVSPDGNTTYDPKNHEDMKALAQALDGTDGSGYKLSSDVKLSFKELVKQDDGTYAESNEYYFEPGELEVEDLDLNVKSVSRINAAGEKEHVLNVSFTKIPLKAPFRNNAPEEPEIEKYVNKAVHDYINLDEVFTYDVLAYVTKDADKVTITDKLVSDLEFVDADKIKVYDLGVDDADKPIQSNHKPVYDVDGEKISNSDNASVALAGTDITTAKGVSIKTDNGELTVVLDDGVDKDTGDRTNNTVKNLRGHWVKVTFNAQIKKELQDEINAGTKKLSDLTSVTVKGGETYKADPSVFEDNRPEPNVGNAPVESDQDHTGIANTASYIIDTANNGQYKDESNTVTVKPEEPELEKYVNKAVHKDILVDEEFTYDIIGFITKDADKVVFEDQLVDDLEFSDDPQVKVVYLEKNNHKPLNDIEGNEVNNDASVNEEGTPVPEDGLTIETSADGKLTVTIDDGVTVDQDKGTIERLRTTVKDLRGKYVKVTFNARIKKSIQEEIKNGTKNIKDLSSVKVKEDENKPVLSDEAHNGIVNEASLSIEVGNEGKYSVKSNKVTVKPEDAEIEKYVEKAVHKDIDLDQEFTYDIMAYVTKDAEEVIIYDDLDNQLQFVSSKSDVEVVALDKNNHKPLNDINGNEVNKDATVNETGEKVDAEITIKAQQLKVDIKDATAYQGKWIKVTFKAKIKDGLTIEDLKYKEIGTNTIDKDRALPNEFNEPVVSQEEHEGVKNDAYYEILVENKSRYEDKSNVVTVKPKEYKEIDVKKTWDDIDDLEGLRPSEVKVNLLKDGEVVDSVVITEADGWKHTFAKLDKNATYTVEEEVIAQYVAEITGDEEQGFEIINHYRSYLPEKRRLTSEETGEFVLTKTANEEVSKEIEFTFKVKMNIQEEGEEEKVYEEEVKLKVGESKKFDFVAEGTEIEVEELEANEYQVTYYLDDAVISKPFFVIERETTKEFNVHNEKTPTPKPAPSPEPKPSPEPTPKPTPKPKVVNTSAK